MTTPTSSARRLRWLALGLLLAGLALAAPGFAGDGPEGCDHGCPYHAMGAGPGPHHGPGFGPGGFIEHHAEMLGIDDATLAEIRAIEESSRENGKALSEARRAAQDDLRALLDQDEPDRDAVMAQVETIGDLETKQHKERVSTMLAIHDKLSAEQRAELKTLREEMRDSHEGMRKHHGMRGHHGGKLGCEDAAAGADEEA
jgi:Spy/CpxP family protein refolding chaperone